MRFFLILLLFYSCSKPGTSPIGKLSLPKSNIVTQTANLSVDILNEGSFASESELDFLQIQEGKSVSKLIKIINNSNISKTVVLSPVTNFIIENNCSSALIPRSSCFIKVVFTALPEKTAQGLISEQLSINDEPIDLIAQSILVPELVADTSELLINPESINMGSFSRNKITRYISISNRGLGLKKIEISSQLEADLTMSNDCPSELPSRSSCTIALYYSSNTILPLASNNKLLINGTEYPVLLIKEIRPLSNDLISFEQTIDFGSLNSSSSSRTIVVKNNDLISEPLEIDLSSLSKYVVSSNCPSVLMSRKKCYFKINVSLSNDNYFKESFLIESKPVELLVNTINEDRILTPMAKLADESIDPTALAGYTKLNQVYLDFTGTFNAEELKISNDSSCSSGSWQAYSNKVQVSLSQNSLNEYSVLFRNGLTETSCIPVTSLIHDSLIEYSFLSSGIIDRAGSNQLEISGICESTFGDSLTYSILDLTDQVMGSPISIVCSSNSYSQNISVPSAAEKIRINAKDKAGNLFVDVKDLLIYGAVAIDPGSINVDADSGFTKNSSLTLDLSSVENAKEMILFNNNTCSSSFVSFQENPNFALSLNSLNSIYAKFKNRTAISSCLSVGSITHDSILPIASGLSYVSKEYGESNSSPEIALAPAIDTNLKTVEYALSTNGTSDNVKEWTGISSSLTSHVGSGSMNNRENYYYLNRAIDKAGNISSVSSKIFKHYDLYPYIAIKDDGSGNKILDNGKPKTNYLYDFVKLASTSAVKENFSGVFNLKHEDTVISTELVSYDSGTFNATNYCNSTTDIMCMVRFTGDATLNGLHIPQVRKKGFVIYVDGDLTINSGASISMTARGASAVGQQVFIHPLASISPVGGNGGAAYTTTVAATGTSYANNGLAGGEGAAGGGAAGGAGRNSASWTLTGGAGSAGTSWSGGSGGGNAAGRNGSCTGGNAVANGGAGGNGCATGVALRDWAAGGGAGNLGGNGSNGGIAGAYGTGGTLIIFVRGNIINNGTIEAKGLQSNEGGGASGGGSLTLIHDGSYTGSGSVSVAGGVASIGFGGGVSGIGGAGSSRIIQANIDDYIATSCNEIKIANPSAVNGMYLIDNDGSAGANTPVSVYCDMVTDGGGWTKIIGDASESSANMKTYIQKLSDYSEVDSSAAWTNHASYGFKIYNLTNDGQQCIKFDYAPAFTQLKFNFWGYYNTPSGGMGTMRVMSGSDSVITDPYLVYFRDAWTSDTRGHDYWLNGVMINDQQQINRVNVPYARTFSTSKNLLHLCFSRYLGYPEDNQGVRNLYIK